MHIGLRRDIRRALRKHYAAEEKIRVALDGLRGDTSIACWREALTLVGFSYEEQSDLFRDMLPLLNSGHLILPRHDRFIAQIVGLDRAASPGTKYICRH